MSISIEKAMQLIQAAHAEAESIDLAITAVVVDESGRLVALGRMDGARPITVDIATNKAYTASSFKQPTSELSGRRRAGLVPEPDRVEQRQGDGWWRRHPAWRTAARSRSRAAPTSRITAAARPRFGGSAERRCRLARDTSTIDRASRASYTIGATFLRPPIYTRANLNRTRGTPADETFGRQRF